MGTYKRLPRGKKKPHDDFVDWTTHALMWVRKHWSTVIEVAALAVVVFAVVVGADAYSRHKAGAAATKLFDLDKGGLAGDERLRGLNAIADSYARTFAGKSAMMDEGDMLLAKGENEKAMERFRTLAEGSRNAPSIRIAALHRLANAQLLAGDPAEAAKTYRKAAADPSNQIALQSELLAAACLERAGDYTGAAELYRRIIDDAGESDAAMTAMSEERLLWLIAKGYIPG